MELLNKNIPICQHTLLNSARVGLGGPSGVAVVLAAAVAAFRDLARDFGPDVIALLGARSPPGPDLAFSMLFCG
jgi:hypothetical protein